MGIVSSKEINFENFDEINKCIVCRGPDEKKFVNEKVAFNGANYFHTLIFNRLSIVDLSTKASQPMYSKTHKTMIMFNGEIYNHLELRKELEKNGEKFITTNSDTEVLLLGLSKFGKKFVNKLIGQFAFIFLDLKRNKYILCRDRLGQKPLFYSKDENSIAFGSNLNAVSKMSKNSTIDESSVIDFLAFDVISSPKTIYKNIYKLKPAELIEFTFDNNKLTHANEEYWNVENSIDEIDFNNDEFADLLTNAIEIRTRADVPVANFLSGGLDSTSIIKNQFEQGIKVNSFSVGYLNDKYDESFWFKQVAKKYETSHKEVTLEDIKEKDIRNALDALDEPYSDPSVVPSYILSKQISKHFKVAISGDGGDELFGGYDRVKFILSRNNLLINKIDKIKHIYPPVLGTGAKFNKYSKNLENAFLGYLKDENLLKLLGYNRTESSIKNLQTKKETTDIKKLLLLDYKHYLPELMMLKVDRTSMANSLEVRSPFVDHRLIEYMFSHARNSTKDYKQKDYLKNYLISDFNYDFVNRKKMGFVFNVEKFIYGNKKLISDTLQKSDYVNSKTLKKLYGIKTRINANRIWKLFILEYYLNKNKTI